MRAPLLDIIIVNWNSRDQLRGCLNSIASAHHDGYRLDRVVVIDNASRDDSAQCLPSDAIPLVLIRNGENRGFAAACNQGAKDSSSDYLLFLNPDTRVYPDTIMNSLRFMEADDNSKIGASTVQLVDDTCCVVRCCARFPTTGMFVAKMLGLSRIMPRRFPDQFYLEWDHRSTRYVDHVIGAYYLTRTRLFRTVGGFDERFFIYLDDLDLSLRLTRAGWKICYFAGAAAYHKGGGVLWQAGGRRLFYSLRSRLLYAAKHFDAFSTAWLSVATLLLEPLSRLGFAMCRAAFREVPYILKGYALLYIHLPSILHTAHTYARRPPADVLGINGSMNA